MGIADHSNDRLRQRPPVASGERAASVPFTRWASRNRLKFAVAVLGGIVALSANGVAATLLRIEPSSGPTMGSVRIETGDEVCWVVALGFIGEKTSGCGDRTFRLRAETGDDFPSVDLEGKFFASVTKKFRTDVNSRRVTIVLIVGGEEVDRASTLFDTANIAY